MRALALLVVVAACRIPDEHFGVRGDGGGGDDAAPVDAQPPVPLTKLYVASNTGLYAATKSATGEITNGHREKIGQFVAVAVRPDGGHLYALRVGTADLAHYVIDQAGNLTIVADMQLITGERLAIHPDGTIVAVAGDQNCWVVTTDSTGHMLGKTMMFIESTARLHDVAFARNGKCLLALSTGLDPSFLYSINFDGTVGQVKSQVLNTQGVLAVHPNSATAYVASTISGMVQVATFTIQPDCSIVTHVEGVMIPMADASALAVDPTRSFLYVSGHAVFPLTIDSDGIPKVLEAPTLMQDPSQVGGGIAVDPAEATQLYVTGPGYRDASLKPGIVTGEITPSNGVVTKAWEEYFIDSSAMPTTIVLAP